jgi:hypothetical protein
MRGRVHNELTPRSLNEGSCHNHRVMGRFTPLVATGLALCLACSGAPRAASAPHRDPADAVRYRLRLRENPVDSGAAFRCYGACQAQTVPKSYIDCLRECPGFEITAGEVCAPYEVPPVAACFTARKVPYRQELDPGLVVVAVIANVALVIGLASLCASSSSQCGYYYRY